MDLRNQLADIEHQRWADWQRYLHSVCLIRTGIYEQQGLVIPQDLVEHWERQIATPYSELSDREKASDLEQVDRYWPLVAPMARVSLLHRIAAGSEYTEFGETWCSYCTHCLESPMPQRSTGHAANCPVTLVLQFLGREALIP